MGPDPGALVLGIESSCDETAAAVVDGRGQVHSNVVSSQVAIHHEFGGVVPELASRHHLLNIVPVVERALAAAGCELRDLAGIAVTASPGLIGALLVGLQFAKSLALVSGRPLIAVDHLRAHLEAPFLKDEEATTPPAFPQLCLLASGGHTLFAVREDAHQLRVLGGTRDDAAGEAFDKVAKMVGLGYPGGEVIDRLARSGSATAIRFPRAMLHRPGFDVSFSGLKTAVKQHLSREGLPEDEAALADLCASFQAAVVEVLVARARRGLASEELDRLVVAGGVAANSGLRQALQDASAADGFELYLPALRFCTDNAAMVALAGQRRLRAGQLAGLDLNASASWAAR